MHYPQTREYIFPYNILKANSDFKTGLTPWKYIKWLRDPLARAHQPNTEDLS